MGIPQLDLNHVCVCMCESLCVYVCVCMSVCACVFMNDYIAPYSSARGYEQNKHSSVALLQYMPRATCKLVTVGPAE